ALVGAHAEGRVALQVFARGKAFARRQRDVGGGHVIVQIDKGAPAITRQRRQRQPPARAFFIRYRGWRSRLPAPEAAQRGGAGTGRGAFGKRARQGKAAARRPDAFHAGSLARRHKGGEIFVETQPALRLRK